jgi:DNA polymerase IV
VVGGGDERVTFLCRRCARLRASARCGECGAQTLAHAELADLSLAHIDCDAFYATIEKRDDPSLAAKPVIVGGGVRGVVTTACYVARAYGVRSAMPMFKALSLCPQAVVIKPDIARYAAEGERLRVLMRELTPDVEPVSIDEAYLDLSGVATLHKAQPCELLARLQHKAETELGFTVSIGLSYNKLLAKIASDMDKPVGFSVIGRGEAKSLLAAMPVGRLPGVGPAGVKSLASIGVRLIGDLQSVELKALAGALGAWGLKLKGFADGVDTRTVDSGGERKTISVETTFNTDLSDHKALEDQLWLLCEKLAGRMRANDLAGRTITLKLKTASFHGFTRRRQCDPPTALAVRLFEEAAALLRVEANGRAAFRLIGVGVSDFVDAADADRGDLLDTELPKRAAIADAVAKARDRFGAGAVASGRTLRIKGKADGPDTDD